MESIVKQLDEFMLAMREAFEDKTIKYTNNNDHITLALFSRIASGCDSCNLLIKNDMTTFVPVILRSALEAIVDISNMTKNPMYTNTLLYALATQERYFLNYFKNKEKFMQYYSNDSAAKKRLDSVNRFFEPIEKLSKSQQEKRKKGANTNSRFIKAEMSDVYKSLYNDLCRHSHNNLDALLQNHSSKKMEETISHKTTNYSETIRYIRYLTEIYMSSAAIILEHFKPTDIDISKALDAANQLMASIEKMPNN